MSRLTVCARCGIPTLNGGKCVPCNRGFRRAVRNKLYDTPYWRKRRRERLTAHREQFGNLCPGYRRAPHRAKRLTLDHRLSLANGGAIDGPDQILCDSCNTRKRWDDTPNRRRQPGER